MRRARGGCRPGRVSTRRAPQRGRSGGGCGRLAASCSRRERTPFQRFVDCFAQRAEFAFARTLRACQSERCARRPVASQGPLRRRAGVVQHQRPAAGRLFHAFRAWCSEYLHRAVRVAGSDAATDRAATPDRGSHSCATPSIQPAQPPRPASRSALASCDKRAVRSRGLRKCVVCARFACRATGLFGRSNLELH